MLGLAYARDPAAYLAVWVVLGAGLGASLYDPAFATLGRIFGAAARRPITMLTLAGGFASTAGWPATHLLIGAVGWRGTYIVYAVLMALICAPLYAFALPRSAPRADAAAGGTGSAAGALLPPHGAGFHAGDRGVHRLCVRAVGAVRASAGDLRPHRHRCRDRGADRHAVRAGAGRGAA